MPPRRRPQGFLIPEGIFEGITESRVRDPATPLLMAKRRARRRVLTADGRLTLLAADHPARMVTSVRDDPVRMGDRRDFLSRVVRVLACSEFDGLMATADVIDELFILERLAGAGAASQFLGGKVLLGSMNRGGLAGTSFELDDVATGYDAAGIAAMNLDGGKFLFRLDPEERDSGRTLAYCAQAMRELAAKGLPIFVEPLAVSSNDGPKMLRDAEKLIKLVGVVSGLSSSSAKVWLKLPYCQGFRDVARSTTLPILLLGGEAAGDAGALLAEVEAAMKAGSNVRGVLMGRNLLYPPGEDPLPLAMAVYSVVHRGTSARKAEAEMEEQVGLAPDLWSGRC